VTDAGSLRLGALLASLQERNPAAVYSAAAEMADYRIAVECDDRLFFSDFFDMFGGPAPTPGRWSSHADIHLDIRAHIHPEFGFFRRSGNADLPVDANEYDFSLQKGDSNFYRLEVDEPDWKCIAFRDSKVPALAFRGRDCIFELGPRWRLCIAWYLFWHLLRIRSDVIFFHASALGIYGEGTIFVGPGGGGKSTTSLALAARGHNFLSDEIAGYVPASGELIPFRRPVGIKPGPRCRAVNDGLAPAVAERIAREGFVRVDINTLFPVAPPQPILLRRIVFLRGFAERPALERITPGRREIVELQPLMSSFLNASHSRRVFELTRLLATAKVYQLHPGDPDTTAMYLEEAFACEKSHP